MKVTFTKSKAFCMKCKLPLIYPSDAEQLHPSVRNRIMILDPNDAKDLTHRTLLDGTPCGGRLALARRDTAPRDENSIRQSIRQWKS